MPIRIDCGMDDLKVAECPVHLPGVLPPPRRTSGRYSPLRRPRVVGIIEVALIFFCILVVFSVEDVELAYCGAISSRLASGVYAPFSTSLMLSS